jgi:hypothetical protein
MALYDHVKVVLSILVGLSLARLLSGATQLAQHGRKRVYWIHLAWVLFMFLYVTAFWWWEFRLAAIAQWTFVKYVFVVLYGSVVYMLCTLLFPNDLKDYEGFREYFLSRRKWFFATMAVMWVADFFDSAIKGPTHLELPLDVRCATYCVLSLIAIKVKNERFLGIFAVIASVSEISFYLWQVFTLDNPEIGP